MRITLGSQIALMQYNISSSYDTLALAQQQVATGKRVSKPSDDPVAMNLTLGYSQAISNIDQYVRNINTANDFLGETSNVLTQTNNQLQQAQTLVLGAMNTTSSTSASATADQLDAIKNSIEGLANTQHLGRYIFSGYKTDSPPLAYLHTYQGTAPTVAASVTGTADLSAPLSLAGNSNLVFSNQSGATLAAVTFTNGMTGQQVADAINTAFAGTSPPDTVSASLDASNHLVLSNTTAGYEPVVSVSSASDAAALAAVGLSAGSTHGAGGFTPQSTAGTLTINGTAVAINANDTSAALVTRINAQTAITGVTASAAPSGQISLTQKDASANPVINVSASGGYTLDQVFGPAQADTTGTGYTYGGNTGSISVQISQNASQSMNVTADKLFNLDGAANSQEPDLFALFDNLKSAVLSGNTTAMGSDLQLLKNATTRVQNAQVDVGARIQNVQGMQTYLQTSQSSLEQLRSNADDADITQAVTNLQTQQQVYQASLYSASTMFQVSLLNYLK